MLVCIPIFALARFDLVLPLRILLIVMAGLQVSTAILLYRLLGKVFAPAIGALAALYWVFNFDILINLYMQGLESGIAAFFVVLLVYKLYQFESSWRQSDDQRKQLTRLGILGALTILSRLDLVFFVALAGVWVLFRGHLLRNFLPLDILAAVVSLFLSFVIRLGLPEYYEYSNVALTMAGLGLASKLLSIFAFGLYQRHILSDFRKTITLLFIHHRQFNYSRGSDVADFSNSTLRRVSTRGSVDGFRLHPALLWRHADPLFHSPPPKRQR
jgi:hypothetical protein